MKKSDFVQMGREDALAGNQSRKPKIPGTWQAKAYDEGWSQELESALNEARQDEAALPKRNLIEAFRRAMSEPPRVAPRPRPEQLLRHLERRADLSRERRMGRHTARFLDRDERRG